MPRYFTSIAHSNLAEKIVDSAKKSGLMDPWADPKKDDYEPEDYEDAPNGDEDVRVLMCVETDCLNNLTPQIKTDLKKVIFDTENTWFGKSYKFNGKYTNQLTDDPLNQIIGLNTLSNGLTFLGVEMGGDWEYPIFFIIYWDGKKIRGYIPKNGNIWNTDNKMAYGNDEKSDYNNCLKRFGCEDYNLIKKDPNKIVSDILKRFKKMKEDK